METKKVELFNIIEGMNNNYELPLTARTDAETRLVFLKTFRRYINDLKNSSQLNTKEIAFIEKTGEKINEVWNNYNKGQIQTASSQMKNLLFRKTKSNKALIDFLLVSFDSHHLVEAGNESLLGFYAEGFQRLFRARVKENVEFLEKELFHIPFNCRNRVANQRFSLSGFPCLYLGGSVYACWLELDKPSFDCFNIIRYQAIQGMKYIDLSLTPANCLYLAKLISSKTKWDGYSRVENQLNNLYERCLFSFPLILACSIINESRSNEDSFRNEYVVPQLLMHSIADGKHGISTVKYLSIKVVGRAEPWAEFTLAIIPKQKRVDEMFSSELASSFSVTNAMNARLLLDMAMVGNEFSCTQRVHAMNTQLYLPMQSSVREYCGIRSDVLRGPLQVKINHQWREYHHTPFGKIEAALVNTGARELKDLIET